MEPNWEEVDRVIVMALAEDIGTGDITTLWTVPETAKARGEIVAKEDGVIAGLPVAERVFRAIDPEVMWIPSLHDGERGTCGAVIAEIRGSTRGILTAERTALNFLQRLSGIATMTARYVEVVQGTGVQITDTRKTTPGLRGLEKYAVRVGGGVNHRFGLYDMVLIKDNHIVAAGGIAEAVRRVKEAMGEKHTVIATYRLITEGGLRDPRPEIRDWGKRGGGVEVETRTLDEVQEALSAVVDRIMLDNMTVETMREAVRIIRTVGGEKAPEIEASGGITLENLRQVAETGVDVISIGALTHSVKALDLSLLFRL
ncbi:MAG: carboxylating nicotinate-nucleotide diphosphorylase [Candidatus Latescibacteria bacterium]|nr:carboxylating nicotinate-nucleotide diphosphorylase [Candidatus Latescibacterota bacterium]